MQRSKHTPHVVYINVPENILIPMVEQDRIFKTMVLTAVQDAGLAWLTPIDIIAAASVAMTEKNLTIPYADVDMSLASKAQKIDISTQREAFVTQILQQIDARIKGSKITYFLEENDITARIKNATASRTVHHQMWMRGVNAFVIALLEKATLKNQSRTSPPIRHVLRKTQ